MSLLAANAAGAAPIVITDMNETRLQWAKRLVPRVRTVRVDPAESSRELSDRIVEAMGTTAKLVLECTGIESSIHAGIFVSISGPIVQTQLTLSSQASQFGGSVFVIGVGKAMQTVPFMHLSVNEIDLRFQFRYRNTYPKAIRLVEEGLINLKPLVTHRYALEEGLAAFATASDPKFGAVKVQILDE